MMVSPIAGPPVRLGPNPEPEGRPSSSGMSTGAKIGLGIGALAAGYGAVKLFRRYQAKRAARNAGSATSFSTNTNYGSGQNSRYNNNGYNNKKAQRYNNKNNKKAQRYNNKNNKKAQRYNNNNNYNKGRNNGVNKKQVKTGGSYRWKNNNGFNVNENYRQYGAPAPIVSKGFSSGPSVGVGYSKSFNLY